jgi:hypothetical protein
MISQYITKLSERYGELTSWNVALMTKRSESIYLLGQYRVGMFIRSRNDNHDASLYCLRKNHILGSPMDEFIDMEYLEPHVVEKALATTKDRKPDWTHAYPDSRILRQEYRNHKKPLLLIYPLDPEGCNYYRVKGADPIEIIPMEQRSNEPYISFAISFPQSSSGEAISYATNQQTEYINSEEEYEQFNDNLYDEE